MKIFFLLILLIFIVGCTKEIIEVNNCTNNTKIEYIQNVTIISNTKYIQNITYINRTTDTKLFLSTVIQLKRCEKKLELYDKTNLTDKVELNKNFLRCNATLQNISKIIN